MTPRYLSLRLLTLAASLASPLAGSGPTAVAPSPLEQSDLHTIIAAPLANGLISAISLGVVQPDGKSTQAHFGSLSPDTSKPPDDHTVYEIGSVSKVFTSLLLAEAVVRGEVALDTPIANLLPEEVTLPEGAGKKITLRMLATHTSGLPRIPASIPPDDYHNPYADFDTADLWETLRTVQLRSAPGARAAYSNLGVGLLGTLLAQRAETDFATLLRQRVTQPLGLTHTTLALPGHSDDALAPSYNNDGQAVGPWEFDALAGAGGIRSTLPDMMRFAEAILTPDESPLEAAINLAWEKQPLAAPLVPGGQGLAWLLAGDGQTHWHNGMTAGFHAALFINRQLKAASVVLMNRSSALGTTFGEELIRLAAGLANPPATFRNRPEVALDETQLDRCVGTYRLAPNFVLQVERRHRALFITPTGQATDRLYAAGSGLFFSRHVTAEIQFELPETGSATGLILRQNDREFHGSRENATEPH